MAQITVSSNKHNRTTHLLSPSFKHLLLRPKTQVTSEEAIGADLLRDLQVAVVELPQDQEEEAAVMLGNVGDVEEAQWAQAGAAWQGVEVGVEAF